MTKTIAHALERLAFLVLSFAIFTVSLFPVLSFADDGLRTELPSRARGEGDPLDTNDANDGDEDPDAVRDSAAFARDSVFDRLIGATKILLVPQYNGSVLTFRIVAWSEITGPRDAK